MIRKADQINCDYCGLLLVKKEEGYSIPLEEKIKLCERQESLRVKLDPHLRLLLDPEEWIYNYTVLIPSKSFIAVTSQRVIRIEKWGRELNNWEIPIKDVENIYIDEESKISASMLVFGYFVTDKILVLKIGYKTERGEEQKMLAVEGSLTNYEKLKAVKEAVEKAQDLLLTRKAGFKKSSYADL
ncbi:MAG: hypothetical protein OdinLCB4_002850 [Candidatus Odinarchaeum yellowstonii]|uniref:Uncharacterized protein n=1 Tax=Odinarchaeota yellowstonii (strain LCB_4) TaxID=1841599 RepID=A0AAF0IBL7_ODILC|nr:MAG: hypothetical protein OdinLCB4_002850 [Candidatus Odinarchaeum yellowstonii]